MFESSVRSRHGIGIENASWPGTTGGIAEIAITFDGWAAYWAAAGTAVTSVTGFVTGAVNVANAGGAMTVTSWVALGAGAFQLTRPGGTGSVMTGVTPAAMPPSVGISAVTVGPRSSWMSSHCPSGT